MTARPARKRRIRANAAPAPVGPYSQGISFGPILFVSGQVGIDPVTGESAGSEVSQQTTQALRNLFAVAEAGGASPGTALRLGVFLSEMRLFDEFNAAYELMVPEPHPARITVGCDLGGWLVEVDGVFGLE